ncbi:MAG TPA: efflux RND transporter periplasmic adaptor subunit [Thermoanaerobaculia bacterium]|nr:efflux RND transporter periplasmic adaptor subunit [Thermoanaerobaculia bacterium]
MTPPRRRRVLALAAVAAVLLIGLWALAGRASALAGEEWGEARRDDLVLGIEVTGTLAAVESASIGPPAVPDFWDFKIAFLAPEGAEVRTGQPVAGFDTSVLQQTLLDKTAERDSAEKELEKRETNLKMSRGRTELSLAEAESRVRKAELKVDVPAELVSSQELAQARADLALARQEVAYYKQRLGSEARQAEAEIDGLRRKRDRAAARLAEVQDAIQKMTVTAPRDGTVVYVSSHREEKKKVGDSVWRGDKIIEIPDLRRMKAEGQVDEADAGRLAVGQTVSLRLDAHPDVVFTGRVRVIHASVQKKSFWSPLKVVEVDIALDRTDPQRMRPGMRFLGTVELERVPRALVIPAEAVVNSREGPVVYRRSGWGVEEVRPRLGRRNDRFVEVIDGLAAGDRLALRGAASGGADKGGAAEPAAGGPAGPTILRVGS